MKPGEAKRAKRVVGWREYVALPELGLDRIKAKIDTGARTTAIHAVDAVIENSGGVKWISFHPEHPEIDAAIRCRARFHGSRNITNTSGVPEERFIISTALTIAGRTARVEMSLADRWEMAFPLIIGRTTLRTHRLVVDPATSWRASLEPGNGSGR